jgi:hypothetical protein
MMNEIFQIVYGFERYFWHRRDRTYYISEHLDVVYCYVEDSNTWWRSETTRGQVSFPARNSRVGLAAEGAQSRAVFTVIRMPRDG